jgi:YbbR domain-containing protein
MVFLNNISLTCFQNTMNKIIRWIASNFRIILLAFILSLAVWVLAVTSSDPDETASLSEPVTIEYIGQDPGLVPVGDLPTAAEVVLRAPQSVWKMITADPASVRAIVDLTGLKTGNHQVDVVIQVAISPVQVISVTPLTLAITLEPLSTVKLPVEITISGEPSIGYQLGEAILSPAEVVISGPESLVTQVVSAQVNIEASGAKETIETVFPVVVSDSTGNVLSGLTVSPGDIQVYLPVEQMGGYRDLAVKVVTVGRAASGYRLASVAAFPAIVTVYSANVTLIEALPGYVETSPLDLSGVSENIETRLSLILPADVTLVGEQTVVVQVGISPIEDSVTISYRPVVIIGLGTGYKAQVSPLTVDVIVSGPIPALESLIGSDVTVSVDTSGLGPGTYQLIPIVSIAADDIKVQSILPSTVQVTITGTGTPSPR